MNRPACSLRHRSVFKSFLWLFLTPLGLALSSFALAATTYYVRTDGGDARQCNGRADAAYPGSGIAQACAWNHPFVALPPSGSRRIAGGDTLIIGPGSYMIGYGAPGAGVSRGRCDDNWRWDCHLPPVPSGPNPAAKTRILGKGHDTGCAAPPTLWGTERVNMILNLEGSSNVEIGCVEITDRSDCVEMHSDPSVRCRRDTPPYGTWASIGVSAKASSNVWLHDLNIHGLANRGMLVGGLTNWTLDRVKINANGWAGWDGDIGVGSSNAGQIILRQVEIGWNGCGQRWQTGAIHACWAQQAGGYGDGLGTAKTGGIWVFNRMWVHHNTSDGLDMLYADGTGSVIVSNSRFVDNAGNQLKTRGTTTIENSIVIGRCAYFNHRDSMTFQDQCRAQGNALSLTLTAGQAATIRHNTITGEGDCLILTAGGTASSRVNIQNNALLGQLDFLANELGNPGELACGHYADNSPAQITYSGNAFWNVKSGQCPRGSLCRQNPSLANMSMASFDATPLAGSPLIDQAPRLNGITQDFYMQLRPSGPAADIGAVEWQGKSGILLPSVSSEP